MRWSDTLIPTAKESPSDREPLHLSLLTRAGHLRPGATAGSHDWLPLGLRALARAERLIRARLGKLIDVSLADRDPLAAATDLVAHTVRSHKQLPLTLFQVAHRRRDIVRPRPRARAGLIGSRDAILAEAFGFQCKPSLIAGALIRLLHDCNLPVHPLAVSDDATGCFLPHPQGDDRLVTSSNDNYSATLSFATAAPRPWTFGGDPAGDLEKIHTPHAASVPDVAQRLNLTPRDVLKNLVFKATPSNEWRGYDTPENLTTPQWLVATVRGDHDVNVDKVRRAAREHFHIESIELIDDEDVRRAWAIGYVGPDEAIRKLQAVLLVDPDAAQNHPWATGANEPDYHVKNFNWFRECGQSLADPRKVAVADLRDVIEGDPSPLNDGATLSLQPAIELARLTRLPDSYSVAHNARYQDDSGALKPIPISSLTIDLGRLLAATVESPAGHDDRGLLWPAPIAPYQVILTPIVYAGPTKEAADHLYATLTAAGIDTLLDDRPDLRAGGKFADADLIGIPLRITLGDRGLKENKVELKPRTAPTSELVALDDVIGRIKTLLTP